MENAWTITFGKLVENTIYGNKVGIITSFAFTQTAKVTFPMPIFGEYVSLVVILIKTINQL